MGYSSPVCSSSRSRSSRPGCGGDDGGEAPEALPSSSCTAIEYEGDGDPDYIIASDFPLQGSSRTQTLQIVAAIRYELGQRDWKAGDYNIGYQSCDDATAQAGKWDSGKCSSNGNAYAANDKVIGIIGTFNSGCAAIIIPVVNQAPEGGIAMVSPANTYPCLTVNLPGGCDSTEPDKYYPSGTRNYARVVPHDAYQGAAVAEFMQSQGVKSVYILNDKEAYGLGVATTTRKAAESLGIKIAGFEAWDPKATSYTSQFQKIKSTGADAVFLGGLIDENGAQVIKDKVAVLGPNDGDVGLYAPDGFTHAGDDRRVGHGGRRHVPVGRGSADRRVQGPGPRLHRRPPERAALGQARSTRTRSTAGSPHRCCSTRSRASDGTRADVITKLFETEVTDGLLGSFKLDENGDPEDASGAVVGFTIYEATDELTTKATVSPKPETVAAASGQ